jgi:nitrogen fixation/metabolism regulation signal transduction histidine kinase
MRNYLLDSRFQLRYTGMVVVVTFVVASLLGGVAYQQSKAQTEMMTISMYEAGETGEFIEAEAQAYDRQFLLSIVAGIALMVFALGATGILVTHRVVGPAFKMKSLFRDVADGHLRVRGGLRKGDELQDVFLEFERMMNKLREGKQSEIARLEGAIAKAKTAGADEVAADLEALRAAMEKELQS